MMCYLVVCPIILFVQVVIILTYVKQRQLRAKPGNIFCAIVSIQTGLNIHLFANACISFYYLFSISYFGSQQLTHAKQFCRILYDNCYIWNCFHCHTFYVFSNVYVLYYFCVSFQPKKKQISIYIESEFFWNTLHGIVVMISIVITLFFFLMDMMGLNFYGLCSLTNVRITNNTIGLPIFQLVASFVFVILGIYTYLYFRKHMPEGENFKRRKQQQSRIILMYVVGFSIFLVLESTISLLLELNCSKYTISGIAILL